MLFGEVVGKGIRGGNGRSREDNRGKGDGAGIRLANAFISIRRGRVTCSPLRSISSTSFARSPLPSAPSSFSLPRHSLSPFVSISSLPLARYLAFTLSLHFSFLSFLFLSSCLSFFAFYLFLSPSLSSLYSLPLWTFSLSSSLPLSMRFCFPSADLFLFSQRRAEREYFLAFARWVWYRSGRVSFKRETVGRNDDAVDDAVCGDSSSSRKRTWYILPSGQMRALLGSSGIINDTHRFL